MSIFDRTSLIESIDEIAPTMESVAEINAELNESVYKLNTSLCIADLLLEQRAQAGEDVEALVEATTDGFLKNIINGIKTAWNKVKIFFRNLLKKVKGFISGNKDFLNKYEKVILNIVDHKNVKWTEYYDHSNSNDILEFVNKTPNVIDTIVCEFKKDYVDYDTVEDLANIGLEFKLASIICPEYPNYESAKMRVDDLADVKIDNIMQYGKKKCTLDKATVIEMIDVVKRYNNNGEREINDKVKILNKMYSECINNINRIADTYGASKVEISPLGKAKRMMFTLRCNMIREAISFAQYVATKASSVYSTLCKHNLSVLKSFVSENKWFVRV